MFDLFDLRAFTRVAELRSVSASARALSTPKSSISRSLARLEASLGSVLVERSTRHLRLTDAGTLFLPHAQRILNEVDEAEAALGQFAGVPRGTLRISAPFSFVQGALTPMLPRFLQRYPEVDVVLEPDMASNGVAAGNADLLIRIGPLPDTAMIARRLVTVELWTCASPGYLAARGLPARPADLAAHDIVCPAGPHVTWSFRAPGGATEEVKLQTRAVVPDRRLVEVVIAGGGGIGQLPDFMAASAIRKGDLVRLLPQYGAETSDLFALYPSHHSLSAKVRVFIDALVSCVAAQRTAFARSPPTDPTA